MHIFYFMMVSCRIGFCQQVPTVEFVGKTMGMYFTTHWCGPCRNFTRQLVDIYNEFKKKMETFEVVFLECCWGENLLMVLCKDVMDGFAICRQHWNNLYRYFWVQGIPTFIILGPNGPYTRIWNPTLPIYKGAKSYICKS